MGKSVHEDDHYWCSSALHLGAFLFSILINNVGTKIGEHLREFLMI